MAVYALYETDTLVIRYIGFTVKSLDRRAQEHYWEAMNLRLKRHKIYWIRSLWKRGANFGIMLLEDTNDIQREIVWIAHLRANDYNLVNATSGGETNDSWRGKRFSEDHKQKIKMSIAAKPRKPLSPETCKKISCSLSGRQNGPRSQETKEKISKALKQRNRSK